MRALSMASLPFLATLVAATAVWSIAAANPMSVGFRIGGYGFRREGSVGENSAGTSAG